MNNYYRPRGFSLFPPIIKNLLIINGVVFFLQIIIESTLEGRILLSKWFALNPINLHGIQDWPFNFQIWQLVTYQFMHGDFSHIFFNMLILWMFGVSIEDVMGSKRFLIFYLLAGIAAGLVQLFVAPFLGGSYAFVVGASGSIYGVMIAFILFFPDTLIFLYFLIPIKAKYLIVVLFVMEYSMIKSANDNIAHLAHLGGAIFAFLYIMFDKKTYVPLKDVFKKSYYYKSSSGSNSNNNVFSNPFKKASSTNRDVEEANYYDINRKQDDEVSQAEIDAILDKISQSGYQNLTEREKKILFQASKKMK